MVYVKTLKSIALKSIYINTNYTVYGFIVFQFFINYHHIKGTDRNISGLKWSLINKYSLPLFYSISLIFFISHSSFVYAVCPVFDLIVCVLLNVSLCIHLLILTYFPPSSSIMRPRFFPVSVSLLLPTRMWNHSTSCTKKNHKLF